MEYRSAKKTALLVIFILINLALTALIIIDLCRGSKLTPVLHIGCGGVFLIQACEATETLVTKKKALDVGAQVSFQSISLLLCITGILAVIAIIFVKQKYNPVLLAGCALAFILRGIASSSELLRIISEPIEEEL